VLPHVGPETEGILRAEGYESYSLIALADPFELYENCAIGLSHTSAIINAAITEMECSCPKCNEDELSPIWGGYPGPLSDKEKTKNDFFCSQCLWLGVFTDISNESVELPA
jgi:hypothetical protein